MRLSSLKVAGFKSFADSTTLYFPENRSAIVGPNGCGKSNVIDAIRWVMGESNARQLRGGSMQDVIFAGTAQRKPMSVASVELRFENTYGKLGGAYNAYTELSIKRQVTREGKSEYFLNGTRCRRKDITDIFLGTGLGPRSYAVIEQGMINRLVDAKPEEMRVFIEEAAGVSRYQARRKDTLTHLQHTQDNLARLNDIAIELQSQIKTLKKQASQAEHYQQLKNQILAYKLQLLSHQYHKHTAHVQSSTQQLTALTQAYQDHHQALEKLEVEEILLQKNLQKELPQSELLQEAWQKSKEQHQQILWKIEQTELQYKKADAKLSHLIQQQKGLQEEQHKLQSLLLNLQQDETDLQKQLLQNDQLSRDTQIQLDDYTHKVLNQKTEIEKQQQDLSAWKQYYVKIESQLEQMQKAQQRANQQLEQLKRQLSQIQDDEKQFELDELNLALATLDIKLETATQKEQDLELQVKDEEQRLNQAKQLLQEKQLIIKNVQRELAQTEKFIQNMQGQQNHPAKNSLIKVLKLTEQGKKYVHYIEHMLEQWLQAETSDALDWSYQGARQLELATESLIVPINLDLPHISTWIDSPQHILWANTYIAKDIQVAQQFKAILDHHSSIVTEDGYWLGRTWLINLNYQYKDQPQGQLHYHQHLEDLQLQATTLLKEQSDAQQDEELIRNRYDELLIALQEVRHQRLGLEKQKQQQTQQKIQLVTQLDMQASQYQQVQFQIVELENYLQEDYVEQAELQLEYATWKIKIETYEPQFLQAQQAYQQDESLMMSLQKKLQDLQHIQQKLKLQCEQHNAKSALSQQDLSFKQAQNVELKAQEQSCEQQKQQLALQIGDLKEREQQLHKIFEQAEQAWLNWQKNTEHLQKQLQTLSVQRNQYQQKDHQLRDELEKVRLDWQQHKTQQQHVLEQIQQEFQQQPLIFDIQFAEQKVQTLLQEAEAKFSKIGAINLAAFEELQILQARYDELHHQIEDLEQTVGQLQSAMKSIDQETKHLFMKVFNQINTELQELFPKVFSGGEASLSLESDWQSGVRLMARPPGKRNSTLALLSGGEKALTALALVFAIFRLNPAPFCVLDEVDAPLDDANVNRFCNLVKELSQQVQFIYITHNKLAMTMATDLLGVTMPDAGSSKLVSVSLAQAEAYTA